jgi:hypothetical protein
MREINLRIYEKYLNEKIKLFYLLIRIVKSKIRRIAY